MLVTPRALFHVTSGVKGFIEMKAFGLRHCDVPDSGIFLVRILLYLWAK